MPHGKSSYTGEGDTTTENYDSPKAELTKAYDNAEKPPMVTCEHCGKKTSASNVGGAAVGGASGS